MSLQLSAEAILTAVRSKSSSVRESFESSFTPLSDSFVVHIRETYQLGDFASDRVRRMLEYTCIGGKYNRGLLIISGIVDLNGAHVPSEQLEAAIVLAWCVEILQSFFLVADDVMDHSVTRRGRPCWYKLEDVGLDAVNDSIILEAFMFFLIKVYCSKHSWYLDVVHLFQDVRLMFCVCVLFADLR
jgi:farnesyl diphosphate synthase